MYIRRVLLQEKERGGNIFSQIKFFRKEAGISTWQAIKLAWNVSFQGKTVLVQLEPGGDPVKFDEMVTNSNKVFNSQFQLFERNFMGLFVDRSVFDLVLDSNNKHLVVFISIYRGAS